VRSYSEHAGALHLRDSYAIHFYHSGLVKRAGYSTFMCQGHEAKLSVFPCEPIAETALDPGIIRLSRRWI
jgi:hypothetical protein